MAEKDDVDKRSAPNFDGKDYPSWEFTFEMWALPRGFWGFFDGSEQRPAAGADRQKWDVRCQDAFSRLCLAMPNDLIRQLREFRGKVETVAGVIVRDPPDCKAAWDRIHRLFVHKNLCSRITYRDNLNALRKQETESVKMYWARAEQLYDDMEAAGGKMDVHEWLMLVLRGLPADWAPLIMIMQRGFDQLTKEQCMLELLQEEARRGVMAAGEAAGGSAAYIAGRQGGKGNWKGKGKKKQQGQQGQQGNSGKGSNQGGKGEQQSSSGDGYEGMAPRGQCHYCKKEGHRWAKCPTKPDGWKPPFIKHMRYKKGGAHTAEGAAGDAKPEGWADLALGEGVSLTVGDASAVSGGATREGWWLDSGATHNFSPYRADFGAVLVSPEVPTVRLGDGRVVKVEGMGVVRVRGATGSISLTKVHFVPELTMRLISTSHLTSIGIEVRLIGRGCVWLRGDRVIARGEKDGGLDHALVRMQLQLEKVPSGVPEESGEVLAAEVTAAPYGSKLQLWHHRLAHVSPRMVLDMAKGGMVEGLTLDDVGGAGAICDPCGACEVGKAHRQSFPTHSGRSLARLDLVHCDLFGPLRVASRGVKARYILSLIDDHSRFVWVYVLHAKSDVAACLKRWLVQAERQGDGRLKVLRTDRGGEFMGAEVEEWLSGLGVVHHKTAPYTSQQNGTVERWHRTMMEGVRTLLTWSGLHPSFWAEALRQIVWMKNRVPHSALPSSTTPHLLWHGRPPDVGMARAWGSMGCVWVPEGQRKGKLDDRGVWCVCMGLDEETKGWRMWDPALQRVRVTRDVKFFEHVPWVKWKEMKGEGLHQGDPPLDPDDSLLEPLFPPSLHPLSSLSTPEIDERLEQEYRQQQQQQQPPSLS
jgi:transposase InsO family protein